MKIYIFTITYNFSTKSIAKKCNTYEEALQMLRNYLEDEIQTIKAENEYTPSVLDWSSYDVTLVYAEGYSRSDGNMNYGNENCTYYRIFEVEI